MDRTTAGGVGGGREEAEQWLEIAEKLLAAGDFIGSRSFAERAMVFMDPLPIDGVEEILAVSDVLLAAEHPINNQNPNWYSILHLDAAAAADGPSLNRSYARLLHPNHNQSPGAQSAFRLVVDAWTVLSDPTKKSVFDAELAAANPPPSATAAFWTFCPFCSHMFQYITTYRGRKIKCQECRQVFVAAEITKDPPIVPGTDMYHCYWGVMPLGFPSPSTGAPDKPFIPMSLVANVAGDIANGAVPVKRRKKAVSRVPVKGRKKKVVGKSPLGKEAVPVGETYMNGDDAPNEPVEAPKLVDQGKPEELKFIDDDDDDDDDNALIGVPGVEDWNPYL